MLIITMRGRGKGIAVDIELSWGWMSKRAVKLAVGHVLGYLASNRIQSFSFSLNL